MPKRKQTDVERFAVAYRRANRGGRRIRHYRLTHEGAQAIMADVAMNEEHTKKRRHEAQLIPGVDGHRIFGFPNTLITKLRYCDIIKHTSTLGATGTVSFIANSIYSPQSGGGHQPLWRDTFATIYNHYVVIGSKIKMCVTPLTLGTPFIAGIVGDDDTSLSTTVQTRMEQNDSTWKAVPIAEAGQTTILEAFFEPNLMFGVDAKDDGASSTAQGSNPTEQWIWGCWIATQDASTTGSCMCSYEIEYTVKFQEPITQTQS